MCPKFGVWGNFLEIKKVNITTVKYQRCCIEDFPLRAQNEIVDYRILGSAVKVTIQSAFTIVGAINSWLLVYSRKEVIVNGKRRVMDYDVRATVLFQIRIMQSVRVLRGICNAGTRKVPVPAEFL
ncbi:hypothetical protein D9M70_596830 [compost metagenome]